ncbi:uncharacterized protein NECHADRAFT_77138 [Fusarium vanettenii 77-13-4]|uniref:SnoaL-like domain-containing protein n=1 Tax=Fusarium vanettenii (strain ATCC MYA-4622 / CBS 123669 / FGSC 9596 / NRRL 45880 / 77-13-4) TaxID=660122 RepID=C7ZCQ8_FUSV7|nr:uncharacterized protein NECHADRAFT_77138 [Fusarium vanettenii 77-13-4]EEU38304.1 predicted protein [Fusarium vanettenii 77-13-4]
MPSSSPTPLYPDIADIRHATPALVEFLRHYFQAKSRHDADEWIKDFDTSKITYIETVLGLHLNSANFEATTKAIMATWGADARSYPLRIIGDTHSAVMFFVDTPAMFGSELRGIAALDMENGKVVRQVDYWDGRRAPLAETRVPESQYPTGFGELAVQRTRNPVLQGIVNELHAGLSTGNSSITAALFDVDAVWEDRTTRTVLDGRLAIERYLARALSSLPYGTDATVRHVVGNEQGGGYEWIGGPGAVARHGMTALKLNKNGLITWICPVWDASRYGILSHWLLAIVPSYKDISLYNKAIIISLGLS